MPQGGNVGWELFDKPSIGVTDFTQKINRQRATQGELERTIQAIDVVKSAKVSLALPKETVFIKDDEKPKASVMLELLPNTILTRNKIDAIQSLVAGSIEGLEKDNVTLVDNSGKLLNKPKVAEGDDEEAKAQKLSERALLVEQQDRQRRDYEKYLEDKIIGSLTKVFGENHVSAQVNVDFDFTVKESKETKYDKKNVPVSEGFTLTGLGGDSATSGGLVGASRHIPPEGVRLDSKGQPTDGSTTWKSEQITNYNVGKLEITTVEPPWQIRRVTAAVLVDNLPAQEMQSGKLVEKERKKLTPLEITSIETLVKQSINYSEERPGGSADMVSVQNLPFNIAPEVTQVETANRVEKDRLIRIGIKYGFLGLIVLLALIFLIRPLLRIVSSVPASAIGSLPGAGSAELAYAGADRGLLEGPDEVSLSLDAERQAALALGSVPQDEMVAKQTALDLQILDLARENPKKVNLVLRSWIES